MNTFYCTKMEQWHSQYLYMILNTVEIFLKYLPCFFTCSLSDSCLRIISSVLIWFLLRSFSNTALQVVNKVRFWRITDLNPWFIVSGSLFLTALTLCLLWWSTDAETLYTLMLLFKGIVCIVIWWTGLCRWKAFNFFGVRVQSLKMQ